MINEHGILPHVAFFSTVMLALAGIILRSTDSTFRRVNDELLHICSRVSQGLGAPHVAPFVVVEPARELGKEPCSFIIYKDPSKVPAKYYERLGLTKPSA